MAIDLTNPVFHSDEKARELFEAWRWPNGPVCPHCGEWKALHRLEGKSYTAGALYCRSCRKKFSVTVGTVMERSHIPISKWMLAFRLMTASKKGMSAHQLHRMLGITYKSAWFMAMRIREAMRDMYSSPIGGSGKIVESDETFVGGKKKNVHKGKPEPKKHAVHALVERGGEVRAKHVADVTAKTLRTAIVTQAHRTSEIHTDESLTYYWLGREFEKHRTVNHSKDEYFKDGAGVQSAEAFFALLKRGVFGTFHSVSEAHLQRYCDEFAFRWNNRVSLGVDDAERAGRALAGASGKRLTYRQTDEAPNP
jgi:transposase-like protein